MTLKATRLRRRSRLIKDTMADAGASRVGAEEKLLARKDAGDADEDALG